MSDPSTQPGTPLHGPGGLLGTPGMGTPRRKRRWGLRTKDAGYSARAGQTIRGNLARGGDGKFTAAGNAGAAAPKRGVVLSKQPKPSARPKPTRAAAPKQGGGKKPAGPKPKDPAALARQAQRDQEHAADRAQRQADRQARLERQAQRDQERTRDRIQRAAEQTGRAADKLARQEATRKRLAAAAKKPAGGGSNKPSEGDKRREREQRATETADAVGLGAGDLGVLRQAAAGLGGAASAKLTALGLIGPDGLTTDQGRRALSAIERGDVRQYQAALQDATARMDRASTRTQAQAARTAKQQRSLDRLARRAKGGAKLTQAQRDQLTDAGLADETDGMWRAKAAAPFAVFKDHSGAHRWITRSTTAYRDRDREIIEAAALDQDSQRMMATKQFGPLRYWHVGQPDPFSLDAPWGPGLDIGDCDYSIQIGPIRLESGTFRDPHIAQAIAQKSAAYELSPGFFYPLDQPDRDGVYTAIRTFERSLVPTRYGRASNLFTGLAVKESRMDVMSLDEMEKRFKTAIVDLDLDRDLANTLGQQLVATVKSATEQRIAFKSAATAPDPASATETIYYGPDNAPGIIRAGAWVALKAAALPPELEAPPVETKADDPIAEIAEEVIDPAPGLDGDYIGDMSWEEFSAKLTDLLAPVIKMQDMVKSIGDAHAELKSMYAGAATKDAGRSQELAALKAAHSDLAAKLAQIEGDQPAMILPDDVSAALKSTGPATQEPNAVEVPDDPSRPFAAIAARTMPALYRTGPDGSFDGWTTPPPAG